MDAERLLQRLCERHGLSLDEARSLVPLVERALISPVTVRDRILSLIEDNLARKSGGDPTATPEQLQVDLDNEVLAAVAKVLHGWEPSKKVRDIGGDLPRDLFGDAPPDADA